MPFGISAPAGTVVPAATPTTPQQGIIAGNGTVYSFNPNAPDPAMMPCWGVVGVAASTTVPAGAETPNGMYGEVGCDGLGIG